MGINSNSGSRPRRRTSVPEQLLVNEFFGQERRSYAFFFIFLGLNRQFQLISIKLEKLQICVFLLIQCKDCFKGLWLSSISNSFWNRADQFDVLKLRRKSSRYLDSLKQSLVGCDFTIGFNKSGSLRLQSRKCIVPLFFELFDHIIPTRDFHALDLVNSVGRKCFKHRIVGIDRFHKLKKSITLI